MAHVPDYRIGRTFEYAVEDDGKLYDAKVAGKVSPVLPYDVDYFRTDFRCQYGQLVFGNPFQILRRVNFL